MKLTPTLFHASIAAALLIATLSSGASQAAVIHYPDLSAGGITVSNITETNSLTPATSFNYGDAGAPSLYGPAVFDGSSLTFFTDGNSGTLPFLAKTSTGPTDLTAVLRFTVNLPSNSPQLMAAFLSEMGDFTGTDGGNGLVSTSIFVTSGSNSSGTNATVTPNIPFTSPSIGSNSLIWTDVGGASLGDVGTSYEVTINNTLHVAATADPASFASIEKKIITVDIGTSGGSQPGVPEPASIGLLGLGAVGLLKRRRR